jgi:hypothetical protein
MIKIMEHCWAREDSRASAGGPIPAFCSPPVFLPSLPPPHNNTQHPLFFSAFAKSLDSVFFPSMLAGTGPLVEELAA